MKSLRNAIPLVLSLFSLSAVWGQTSYSLEDAKVYALENHLNILNSRRDVEIAEKQIVEYTGMGFPQIDFSGQFNHFLNIPVSVVDATFLNPMAAPGETISFKMGTEFSTNGSLQVNQLLFNGSYIVGLKASKEIKRFQESSLLVTQEDVVFNVIQAYQLAAISKGNKSFADSMVVLTAQLVDKQKNYLDLGLLLQEDMDQLNFSLLSAKNSAVSADLQYQNAMNLLKFYMGISMNEEIEITDSAEDLISKPNLSNGDLHNNLQYALMQQNIVLTKLDVKNKQFANLPSLYAFFTQAYNAYRNEFNFFNNEKWYPQTVWGLQLKIPIFSGLQRYARTKQTQIKLLKDQSSLEQLERTLQFSEIQSRNNLKGAQDRYELQKQNTDLARTIYKNALEVEQIGKGNSITVTQKHNQLMVAQAQYLGALMDLFKSQLELDKLYNELVSKNQ